MVEVELLVGVTFNVQVSEPIPPLNVSVIEPVIPDTTVDVDVPPSIVCEIVK